MTNRSEDDVEPGAVEAGSVEVDAGRLGLVHLVSMLWRLPGSQEP